MNSLNRTIAVGEKVVLKKSVLKPQYRSIEWRTVTVLGGFGMLPNTCGSALYVQFQNGEKTRVEGYHIDKLETNKLIKDNIKG